MTPLQEWAERRWFEGTLAPRPSVESVLTILRAIRMGLALALLVALPCAAQDAPVVLDAGQPAPTRGLLLPEALAIQTAQEKAQLTAENASLRKAVESTPAWLIVPVSVVAALAVGFGVGYAAKK